MSRNGNAATRSVKTGGFCRSLARSALASALVLVALLTVPRPAAADQGANIACAASVKPAVDEIAAMFGAETGKTVRPTYGSSGNFFRQISQGAPFELFLSADMEFAAKLVGDGKTDGAAEPYAVGRIVLFAPNGSPVDAKAGLDGLKAALGAGKVKRFAIANPMHAPYGRAAEQALRNAGLWDGLQDRLVLGENVSQAAQFATTGSVEGAIFAYSLALSPAVAQAGSYVLLPESLHQPLQQGMVLLKDAGPTARAFRDFLRGPAARAVFRRHGFTAPGESS